MSPTLDLDVVRGNAPPGAWLLLWLLLAAGLIGFVVLFLTDRQALWLAYLANFLFFTGLMQNGVVWSAVTRGCNGRWARPLQRIADGTAAVLPASVLLFLPLIGARRTIFPWWGHPPAAKLPWLDPAFLWGRDLAILIAMAVLSLLWLRASLRPGGERRLNRLWVVLVFAFAYLYSILGLDLNMSLNLHWYDYIYGWFFFIAAWYGGLALVALLGIAWRRWAALESVIRVDILHDQGKLIFSFAIFWTYLFWAQFMVLWFANRQDDITILLRLSREHPWVLLSWITLALAFFAPFALGLSRAAKRHPLPLAVGCVISLLGLWMSENLIVDVSLWYRGFPPLWQSAWIACGFAGLYGLIYLKFMSRVPVLPTHDPWMREALVVSPVRH